MQIKYDKIADAKYVTLKKGKVARTREAKNWLMFDEDKDGEVLGVEILNASKHPVSIFSIENNLAVYEGTTVVGRSRNQSNKQKAQTRHPRGRVR